MKFTDHSLVLLLTCGGEGGGGRLIVTWPKSGPSNLMNYSTYCSWSKIWMQEYIYFVFFIVNLVFYVNHLIHFGSPKWSCTIYYGHNIDKYMLNYDHTRGKPSKETKFRWYHIVYQKIVMTKIYIYIYFNEQQLCQIVYFSVYPKFILILGWSNKSGYRVVMLCFRRT